MGLDLYLIGVSRRRIEIDHCKAWLHERCVDDIESISVDADDDGNTRLKLCLHPAAEDVEITWRVDSILVGARTTPAGPGYHLYVADLFRAMGQEFAIEWLPPSEEEEAPYDDTEYFFSGNREVPGKAFDAWLGTLAEHVAKEIEDGESGGIHLGMPLNCGFVSLDAVATPLGPRSLEWLKRTAADPSQGHDFYAWPNDGKDAEYFRGRALVHIWNDVRWCTPFRKEEVRTLRRVDELLLNAFTANPHMELPWREWEQVRNFASIFGKEDASITENAARVDPATPLIGYRRYDVHYQLSGGWSITIPGSFIDWWEEDSWHAADEDRTIHLSMFTVTQDGNPTPAEEIIAGRESMREWTLRHAVEEVLGLARFHYDREEERWNFSAVSAAIGKMAILTVSVPTPADQTWAEGIWRSLRNRA